MSQCVTSTIVNTSITPQTVLHAKEEQESSGTSKRSKRGQSIDDSVLTSASKPSWRESLRAKRQKLKERSLTIDHFYR